MDDSSDMEGAMRTTMRTLPDKEDDWPVNWPVNSDGERLTHREAEVAGLVSQGLANRTVAAQLGVREGTVKVHLHNIYRKLGVSNRTALALDAISVAGQLAIQPHGGEHRQAAGPL